MFEVEDREVEVEDEGEKLKEVSEDQNMVERINLNLQFPHLFWGTE